MHITVKRSLTKIKWGPIWSYYFYASMQSSLLMQERKELSKWTAVARAHYLLDVVCDMSDRKLEKTLEGLFYIICLTSSTSALGLYVKLSVAYH